MAKAKRRWRRASNLGWAGFGFFAALYLASLVVDPTWRFPNGCVLEAVAGGFRVAWSQPLKKSMRSGWRVIWPVYEPWDSWGGWPEVWWFHLDAAGRKHLFVPLWIPLCGCLGLAVYARHRARPFKTGLCACCGYDLWGITASLCPECGAAIRGSTEAPIDLAHERWTRGEYQVMPASNRSGLT